MNAQHHEAIRFRTKCQISLLRQNRQLSKFMSPIEEDAHSGLQEPATYVHGHDDPFNSQHLP